MIESVSDISNWCIGLEPTVIMQSVVYRPHKKKNRVMVEVEVLTDEGMCVIDIKPHLLDNVKLLAKKLIKEGVFTGGSFGRFLAVVTEALQKSDLHSGVIVETHRTGWQGYNFVSPRQPANRGHGVCLQPFPGGPFGRDKFAGTLEAWKKGMWEPCQASKPLTFALALGFAAPLVRFSGLDQGLICVLEGRQTDLILRAARSLYGAPDACPPAIETIARKALPKLGWAFNDTLLVIDEALRFGAKPDRQSRKLSRWAVGGFDVGEPAQDLGGVPGGLRYSDWCVTVLATSYPTDDADAYCDRQVLRLPVSGPIGRDIFDLVDQEKDNRNAAISTLYSAARATIVENFGLVGYEFARRLCTIIEAPDEYVPRGVEDFVEAYADDDTGDEVVLARQFGLVAFAGCFAARLGFAPWSEEHCESVCADLFEAARRRLAGVADENVSGFDGLVGERC